MSRSAEIFRLRVICHTAQGCHGPFRRGNAGRGIHTVNGNGKCGLMIVCIVGNHLRELKLLCICRGHRHADQTLSVSRHKVNILRGGKLCRTDKIPFILPVCVVCHHNDMSFSKRFQRFLYCIVLNHNAVLLSLYVFFRFIFRNYYTNS